MRKGIKRWAVRYRYSMLSMQRMPRRNDYLFAGLTYGPNLRALVIYLLIELRLSNQKAAEHVSLLFDLPLDAYNSLPYQVGNGREVHADLSRYPPPDCERLTGSRRRD